MRCLAALLSVELLCSLCAVAQKAPAPASAHKPAVAPKSAVTDPALQLAARIQQIVTRPVFRHAQVGVEIYDLTAGKPIVAIDEQKLFNSASTTKLITEGAALALLGPDYRFHTRVFHTGAISNDGTLTGDLILVAAGDPNLSGRVLLDDSLDYTSSDHSYAAVTTTKPVRGEPLRVFKELASAVLMKGIVRVRGRILVDATAFPSGRLEPATHAALSPIVFNDNVIDVTASPAERPGQPAALSLSPQVPYLRVVNHVTTGRADSEPALHFASDVTEADGTHTAALEGSVPADGDKALAAYKVQDPVLFAAMGFREALRWAKVEVDEPDASLPSNLLAMATPAGGMPRIAPPTPTATKRTLLAEHISPPFKQEVKLTLKVSQNLHAALTPYLVGSIVDRASGDAEQKGLASERGFLASAGLDPAEVSQLDGEGGLGSAFSPDFMVRYLTYMQRQPYGQLFFDALPVLGRDGTLAEMEQDSPAAGHVHAKTGSYVVANNLTGGVMLLAKGLVGYVDAANGHRLAFAAYVNMIPLRNMDDVSDIGSALVEIAEAAYGDAPSAPTTKPASPRPAARKPSPKPAPRN